MSKRSFQIDRSTLYTPERIQALMTQDRAMEMRAEGKPWEEIRCSLGFSSEGAVIRAVKRALLRRGTAPAQELKQMQEVRLDGILREMTKLMKGEGQKGMVKVNAALTILKVEERRAALYGLDAPKKMAQTDAAGRDIFRAIEDIEGSSVHALAQLILDQKALASKMAERATLSSNIESPKSDSMRENAQIVTIDAEEA